MFPCSEFIRRDAFRGGNLFRDEVEQILVSRSFQFVTGRNVDGIDDAAGAPSVTSADRRVPPRLTR